MKRILPALLALLLLGACSEKEQALSVESVSNRTIIETVAASGKIQPEIEVKITSEVSGQIIELPVKEGDLVSKGDLLVRINPDLYDAAVNRAEAALNTAQSNLANSKARGAQANAQYEVAQLSYNRSESLFNQGAISQSEWDNARSTFEVAKAEVEAGVQSVRAAEFSIQSARASRKEAADNLSRTTILAPQDGTVTALTKEEGEMVLGNQMMAGETIMKVSQLQTMEVNVEVNESDIVRVALGDTAMVEVDAYQDEEFQGIVTEIGNTALNSLGGMALSMDQVTNFSVKIRILPDSYNHLCEGETGCVPFRPGMSATVEVETEKAVDVASVPIRAITTRTDTTASNTTLSRLRAKNKAEEEGEEVEATVVAFVANRTTGKVELRVLETGVQDSRYIQITGGLEADDEVVVGPYIEISKNLAHGDKRTFEAKEENDTSEASSDKGEDDQE